MCARVLLGVTGGIAAYKAVELTRLLQQAGHEVTVLQTRAAREFVGASTFAALTGRPVITDDLAWSTNVTAHPSGDGMHAAAISPGDDADPHEPIPQVFPHLDAARNHDVLAVVPATANMLGRMANGIADDVLSSTYLAFEGPVIVAPAMNTRMWAHAATRRNLRRLIDDGVVIVQPSAGVLACGDVGEGRLAPVGEIFEAVELALGAFQPNHDHEVQVAADPDLSSSDPYPAAAAYGEQDLAGYTVLVTAGGTREPIDDVRFITNRSSGRMGIAVAQAAFDRGARVQLVVTGAVDRSLYAGIPPEAVVESAAELAEEVRRCAPQCEVVVMTAAVSDFTVDQAPGKLKRGDASRMLELRPTDDILAGLGSSRARSATPSMPILVGFAAESGPGGIDRARSKLERKRVDLMVHNDIARDDIGFESESNEVTIIAPTRADVVGPAPKRVIADAILDRVASLLRVQESVLR